ncbi:hypothetical protein JMJ35_003128 [Cladonia borealis]|uniref:Uncharacterized protein n=1 Tax=Cladonia borealis TaxID=184061 RepID=A0AA39UCI5_9LECA|nr:hypothetical protein JMJ35_003128 [Cladonia borealis]
MDFHDYGKALYQVTSDEVTPGKVGYFDRKGNWNLVVDLNDEADLRKMNLSGVTIEDGLRMEDTITPNIISGPKYSKTVKESELKTSGSVDTDNDDGAILLSSKPVTRTRRHEDATQVYKSWVQENEKRLLKNDGIRKYGFWVVLSTYTSTDCSWKVWSSAQTEFTLAFETALQNAGSVELSGRWRDTSQVGGWTGTPKGKTSVIFMDGMKFSTKNVRNGFSKYTIRTLALCFKDMKEKHMKLKHSNDPDLSDTSE